MRIRNILAAAALFATSLFSAAEAAPITYTLTGQMDGTIGATTLNATPFTWTITSDTTAAIFSNPFVFVPAFTDILSITGVGNVGFTLSSAFVVIPSVAAAGFTVGSLSGVLAFTDINLLGYQGISSLGPLPVTYYGGGTTPTDHGDLLVTGAVLTFQASTVPEPVTLALFGAGLAGIGALRRRKQKA